LKRGKRIFKLREKREGRPGLQRQLGSSKRGGQKGHLYNRKKIGEAQLAGV